MTDYEVGKVLLITGILCTIFCFKFIILRKNGKVQRLVENAKRAGRYTTATAVKKQTDREVFLVGKKDHKQMLVTYEYEVDGKKYYKCISYEGVNSLPAYPYEITVYWDDGKPEKAVGGKEIEFVTLAQGRCLVSIVFTVFVMKLVAELIEVFFI